MTKQNLIEYIAANDIKNSRKCVEQLLSEETDYELILSMLMQGLKSVGEKYEKGEYFIADLIVAGTNIKEILMKLPIEGVRKNVAKSRGLVVIGTIYEDIHDIGKDLVADVLRAYGYDIFDLGVDVSVERFMEAIKEKNPGVVAISCVMSGSLKYVLELCERISREISGKPPKVVVGGSAIDEQIREFCDADFFTDDLFEGVNFITGEKSAK